MRKTFTFLFAFIGIFIFSQTSETETKTAKREIKFNLLTAVIGAPELTFEYLLKNNQSVGISAAFSLDSKENLDFNYGFLPYYRIYFGKKPNAGFFVEGNASVTNFHYGVQNYTIDQFGNTVYSNTVYGNETNFGFGVSTGVKLLTKNNLVAEVFAGLGRRFAVEHSADAFPRIGITIGKRF